MYKKLILLVLACAVVCLQGCGSSQPNAEAFVRENVNLTLIKKIAVLPFEGGGRAPRIRELTMTQLLAWDIFDLVDKSQVDVFLQQEAVTPGAPLDVFTIRRMGESLGVEAVMLGSVEQGKESRGSATFIEYTMTLRLIECETGELLWQASGSRSGYSLADRLFGFAPKDDYEVLLDLLDELFLTLEPIEEG